jgi:hypothetical protein
MEIENDIIVINEKIRAALIENYTNEDDDFLVVAHWSSLTGQMDHYGVSINPQRPTVCWGFVPFDQGFGEMLDFGTFWIDREQDNPYSFGNCLSEIEYPGDVFFNGEPVKFPMFSLDATWKPMRFSELKKIKGWD